MQKLSDIDLLSRRRLSRYVSLKIWHQHSSHIPYLGVEAKHNPAGISFVQNIIMRLQLAKIDFDGKLNILYRYISAVTNSDVIWKSPLVASTVYKRWHKRFQIFVLTFHYNFIQNFWWEFPAVGLLIMLKVFVRGWLRGLLVRYLRPCAQGLHFSLTWKLHFWLAVKELYISSSGAEHWLVRGAVHRTPRRYLGYTSAWPGNCIFGWLSKNCTSARQGLKIGLPEGLCIGLPEGIFGRHLWAVYKILFL